MPEIESQADFRVFLDRNVPREAGPWLQEQKSSWQVVHASQVGLEGKPDSEIFAWAQQNGYLIITFDEDFADQRSFPVGQHYGVIRLRVWPTTIEETQNALIRLLEQVTDTELLGALVIVGARHIRIRARDIERES
ncbi:MAG: DUF5615 family PIN-like protein [Dehalococcoidia bacterium]